MKNIALQILGCSLLCRSGDGKTSESPVALIMEGGGWRAQTAYTGLLSGMLGYVNQEQGTTSSLDASGLLDRVDMFSSNSGGSWFFSSLAYSEKYLSLVEGIAANPETAGSYHNQHWTVPVLKALKIIPARFNVKAKLAKSLADKYLGVPTSDTIWMLAYILETNATWTYFTAVQLEAGASIGPEVHLGSAVNAFAENKSWLACHSVLLPSAKAPASLYQTANKSQAVSYYAQSPEGNVPTTVPAMFSVKMGTGTQSMSPYRYAAETVLPGSIEYVYSGVDSNNNTFSSVSRSLSGVDFTRRFSAAAQMPVAAAVSASSAAAGIAPVLGPLVAKALALVEADLTPWFTNTGTTESLFTATTLVNGLKASDGITQESLEVLAAAQLHGQIDGAYTDNLGLANAIAAGANEALVFSNANHVSSEEMEYLFQGSKHCVDPGCFTSPVFADSAEFVQSAYDGFHRLSIGNTTYLNAVAVGTFTTTTVDNRFYGISAGRSITVHVVQMCGDLSIGFFEDITRYNTFVQEIVQAVVSEQNRAFVQSTLLPLFMGSAQGRVQVV